MGVYIGEPTVISDMQGPAPAGFHVPLSSEWQAVHDILITTFGLARNATTMGTYLKMPMAGYRDYEDSDVYDDGGNGSYWSSTTAASNASYLDFDYRGIHPQSGGSRTNGFSVRCFKNVPISFLDTPLEGWTVLYQGSGNAGIYRNQNRGIISVSGDGVTWYTIMDKNLGATAVYNQGDTLTDANCGYFYQWGNNYGFPHSGTVTTSSTKVDASNYGPGNYYNSSTFITGNDWSSVRNDNLWGGVTQGTTTKNTELKNAYIGEGIWKPGADTILYLPFETDLLDHSQTGLALTNSGGVTISDGAAYFSGSNYLYSKAFTQINQSNFTASVWFKSTSTANTERVCLHQFRYYSSTYRGYAMGVSGTGLNAQNTYMKSGSSTTVTTNERHNLILVRDGANQTSQFYFDGQAITMTNADNYPELYGWLGIGGGMWYNSTMGEYKWIGYMSNIIYENKARTSQEVANYYNLTKSNYGL